MPPKLGTLSHDTSIKKTYIIRFLMILLSSKTINFMYIITFLDSLLKGLQEYPTLKQIISLDTGLKCIINNYNKGYII